MRKGKCDLVIHYDETRQCIVLYSTSITNTEQIRAREFDGVRPEVAFFKGMPPSEAEETLGGMVFSLLDHNANQKINIRDYAALAEEAHVKYVEDLEREVREGDIDAHFHLFVHLHSTALRNCSPSDLARAEEVLKYAAGQGHTEAAKTLADWPMLKAAAQRRFQRGKDA